MGLNPIQRRRDLNPTWKRDSSRTYPSLCTFERIKDGNNGPINIDNRRKDLPFYQGIGLMLNSLCHDGTQSSLR